MELVFLTFALIVFMASPLMSGLFARSVGRSFWKWFGIGCLIPILANVVLFVLETMPEKDSETETKNI